MLRNVKTCNSFVYDLTDMVRNHAKLWCGEKGRLDLCERMTAVLAYEIGNLKKISAEDMEEIAVQMFDACMDIIERRE